LKKCPKCGAVGSEADTFCGSCGTPLALVSVPQKRPPREEEPYGGGPLLWFLDLFPGLLSPKVLAFSLIAMAMSLVAFWLAAFFIQFMVISAFAIGGGGVIIYWCALCWLLYGYVVVPVEAMSEFRGKHWMAFVLLTLIPGALFLFLVKLATSPR